MESMGRVILSLGLFLVIIGLLITFGSKIGIGRLPGDIFVEKGNFKFFFPITTSIILSIVLSLLLRLFRK